MPQGNKVLGKFTLNGVQSNAPIEWGSIETLSTFDREAVQANISIDKMTFVNTEASAIKAYIEAGMTGGVGIFEGLPLQLQVFNQNNTVSIFDGLIDLTDGLEIKEWQNKYSVKLRLKDELLTLEEKLTALSYAYLESLGLFSSASYTDVQYVVQKKLNIMETISSGIVIYIMTKELITMIEKIPKDVSNIAAHIAGGATGFLAGVIYSVAIAILDIAYSVALLIAVIKMVSVLLDQLIPVKRKAKCLKMRTALENVASHLGWSFQSNIADLDKVYFLPSNFAWDETNNKGVFSNWKGTPKGIPNITDYGYNCSEMFELAKKLFNGKYAIVNGVLCFYNVDDLFWVQQSTFQMPGVRDKLKTYNTEELMASRLFSFECDYTDEHTVSNYKGTSYQVITNASVVNNINYKFIKGLEEVRFGVSLASRKDHPYGIESFLMDVAQTVDGIVNFFGGSSNYTSAISTSVGLMIIGTNNYAKPKVIKCNNSMRLVDRDSWSAKYIYETYYKGKSFVSTINGIANYGQKTVYKGVRIPFGMDDYLALIQNSYFTTPEGKTGKVVSCKWQFSADHATVDFFIREPYTKNLFETYIEPTNT